MSKVIKQMEMDALRSSFEGVRDAVVLSVKGLSAQLDGSLRATLRKKNIRMQVVKNSLTRRVFNEMGIPIAADSPYWQGPTTLAWGANSIADLSRAIEDELKKSKIAAQYKDKVVVKGAIADGQLISFDLAVKMPTLPEALGQILSAILGPGSAIAGCLTGPISQVASQIQTISEKTEEAAVEAAPAPVAG
ncbi:MAG TPA: 50S ribosomal protein L10 [Gemmataceae bacterium]|nr:50S ribosomal protein L10 [Gemmataceae bacterium]